MLFEKNVAVRAYVRKVGDERGCCNVWSLHYQLGKGFRQGATLRLFNDI